MSETPKLDELWMTLVAYIDAELRKLPWVHKQLKRISSREPPETAIISAAVILLLVAVGALQYTAVTALACVYPCYRTLLAARQQDQDDRYRWLTFWLVLGATVYLDPALRLVLSFVPLFDLLRLGLYVALMHPQIDWSMQLFVRFLKPHLIKVEPIRRQG